MTKDELWNVLLERYPDFKDEEFVVKLRARGLRNLINQAWDEGFLRGVENGKALESMRRNIQPKPEPTSDPFMDLFKPFFGKDKT